jgi:hypothetical protein
MNVYKEKYLKYKTKYIELKNQIGGLYEFKIGDTIYYKIIQEYQNDSTMGIIELVDEQNKADSVVSIIKRFDSDAGSLYPVPNFTSTEYKSYVINNLTSYYTPSVDNDPSYIKQYLHTPLTVHEIEKFIKYNIIPTKHKFSKNSEPEYKIYIPKNMKFESKRGNNNLSQKIGSYLGKEYLGEDIITVNEKDTIVIKHYFKSPSKICFPGDFLCKL